ncbi:MAG: hypothetical protein ACNA8W_05200 [Bradymonadaceae bacterium]
MILLEEKFNDWLTRHLDKRRSDRLTEHDLQSLRLLLGGAYGQAVQQFRLGHRVPFGLRNAIRELVDLDEPSDILRLRRDQILARDLRYGIQFNNDFGHAPDGGSLQAWAVKVRERLDATFDVTVEPGGEAGELWGRIVAPANLRRRQRYAT